MNRLNKLSGIVICCAVLPFISIGQTNLTIETAIKIEFPTVETNAYMLEQSTNLVDWSQSWQNWSAGYGFPITRFYEIANKKLYYRVQATPRPAVVATTIPENGAMDVDPAITNLVVNFSSNMSPNGSGGAHANRSIGEFPFAPGGSRSWIDAQTYTTEISLKTNTTYYAELSFTSAEGIPTLPFILTFKTRE